MNVRRMVSRRECMLLGLKAFAAGIVLAPGLSHAQAKATAPADKVDVKSTLENLQTAYNGESNAAARYQAFAKNADAEGYGKVASLFRAASKAEGIHARNHARVIRKMGGVPKADVKAPEAKSTKENLAAAIQGETYEDKVMYSAFLAQARREKNAAAVRTFNFAKQTEANHAQLYTEALKNLEAWKGANQNFYVCDTCGNTVMKVDFKKCPICKSPKEEYVAVI